MKWIKAKDKLPDRKNVYLVYSDYGIVVAIFYPEKEKWYEEDGGMCPQITVTHWMALPPEPKIEND